MKNFDRYKANSSEDEFEPGSDGLILKNSLGLQTLEAMEIYETQQLTEVLYTLLEQYSIDQQMTCKDICSIHEMWLHGCYGWAGKYRSVNMSKQGFLFAAAHLIPNLMAEFERTILAKYTPCNFTQKAQLIEALAVTHVEFILIHPFREGNGRLGRLMMTLMAAQAGQDLINFDYLNQGDHKEAYFAAIRCGLERDYQPMIELLEPIIAV